MSTIERGEPFRSRLVKFLHSEPIKDYDPVPLDAKERILALHDRLAKESEGRGGNTFSVLDQQNRMWEIKTLEEVIVETKYRSFVMTRSIHDMGSRLRRAGSGIKTLESFFVDPWQVSHLDFSRPHFKPAPISGTKTLAAAERIMISLFPDFIPFVSEPSQAPVAPEPISG